ncbi:hypothetical protein FPRO05_06150 [Fusarium proliferatum]|uniref:Transcription factor domain-containing protein n=1 Tax=Gibberella intermedia TaxID=948311 RepID=A0A365MNP1_GIBIN|nr:hypothetical protein FPRO05_06150 [Fusarium proliferatum]
MLFHRAKDLNPTFEKHCFPVFRPDVFHYTLLLETVLLGPTIIEMCVSPELRDYFDWLVRQHDDSKGPLFACQNPLSCVNIEYSRLSLPSLSSKTRRVLAATSDLLSLALHPPAHLYTAHEDPLFRTLTEHIVLCSPTEDEDQGCFPDDKIYDSCRLAAQLSCQMALLHVARYPLENSSEQSSDTIDLLISRLHQELQSNVDTVHLWDQCNGILLWVVIVGSALSRGTPQHALFKAILWRLSAIFFFSDTDDVGYIRSLKTFLAYQEFCVAGHKEQELQWDLDISAYN